MTVNQVFEILIAYTETRDWTVALERCLPRRKRANAEHRASEPAAIDESTDNPTSEATNIAPIDDAAEYQDEEGPHDTGSPRSVDEEAMAEDAEEEEDDDDDAIFNSGNPS